MADILEQAYTWLDSFRISPEILAGLTAVLALAFLFAMREAVSWFFKTHDIKRDLARLEELTLQLEGEIRSLQQLIRQQTELSTKAPNPSAASAPSIAPGEPSPLHAAVAPKTSTTTAPLAPSAPAPKPLFPLSR